MPAALPLPPVLLTPYLLPTYSNIISTTCPTYSIIISDTRHRVVCRAQQKRAALPHWAHTNPNHRMFQPAPNSYPRGCVVWHGRNYGRPSCYVYVRGGFSLRVPACISLCHIALPAYRDHPKNCNNLMPAELSTFILYHWFDDPVPLPLYGSLYK